ncbi:hypothetical protein HN385_05260 [archaeon]|jgi:hypothetical protein|nr:hypothetical protein [archaeon]MBT3451521.1 hypothetical protein [archaeon]MBT6869509.1 hypothetical protein [archaeon]MBT7193197.1 hypothetical protein [archaeon]MBT7380503.1 hypothetical protein [archaeon]
MVKKKRRYNIIQKLENLRSVSVIMLIISLLLFTLAIIVESAFFSSMFLLLAMVLLITWTLAYSHIGEKIKKLNS